MTHPVTSVDVWLQYGWNGFQWIVFILFTVVCSKPYQYWMEMRQRFCLPSWQPFSSSLLTRVHKSSVMLCLFGEEKRHWYPVYIKKMELPHISSSDAAWIFFSSLLSCSSAKCHWKHQPHFYFAHQTLVYTLSLQIECTNVSPWSLNWV